MTDPRFASALSTEDDPVAAERTAVDRLLDGWEGGDPDLVLAFASSHYGDEIDDLGGRLAARTRADAVLGCTGESIIGGPREIEGRPALALWAARLPDTAVRPFRTVARPTVDGGIRFHGGPTIEDDERASLIVLADPFTFPMDEYLKVQNRDAPGVPAVGGMASGARRPGQTRLWTEDGLVEGGLIGVVLEGETELVTVVSQGCRPVGRPWVVTKAAEHTIRELGGQPALDVLMRTLQAIDEPEQELFRAQPFIGLATDATKSRLDRDDFLVRGLTGVHPEQKAISVAASVRPGQTVQFLVRDAASASADLEFLLNTRETRAEPGGSPAPRGALLFSCNGRGRRMFGEDDHDASRVLAALGTNVPLAGFFAMGEVGPVGQENHLHGFTASVAWVRRRHDGA